MFGKRYRDKETGIIYDENGKPCKSCNIFSSFQSATTGMKAEKKKEVPSSSDLSNRGMPESHTISKEVPDSVSFPRLPDVAELGRSTWTFLHAMAANYPKNPSTVEQTNMSSFLHNFSKFYPCWACAEDLRLWMARDGNAPKVETRESLCHWICEAHNDVNERLGKPVFNCDIWAKKASKMTDE
ncbi:mitochondrial Mia40-Erv1 disulfide relay system sulfhydryl oxidase subunit Erv1 [Schizosaccharomyces osmophilus]|uniref:Sulfhydryl oxidase n=1 Tax=Schizosaccharomyces osmophilus TaxID=2545709 RepID=A0AAF0AVR4_9SCHI|nr:mitochondrial Mia40-Erv1 disulfide relay system sulfhydryl oxidase subunit Erv1 [Schizosaccharomyces osmophilus]WBW72199.1 mitochondrial Mia40-Erv1 disulfide relay system sulfhydryl oxidase subunit Erv1 [Schizosaccharomyces osmophilus]